MSAEVPVEVDIGQWDHCLYFTRDLDKTAAPRLGWPPSRSLKSSLDTARWGKFGPPIRKIGKLCVYNHADLRAWINSTVIEPTATQHAAE